MKCLVCKTETSNPKYCSLRCAGVASWQGRLRKDKTKQCVECQKQFQYKEPGQKFCSRSCSAKYNNVQKGLNSRQVCTFCKKKYAARHKNSTYCSRACMGASRTRETIQAWIDDPTTGTFEQGLKRAIRSYLIEQANYQCSQCQWGEINPTTGKAPLEVDHIDGDCYNNRAENLRVLCPNCHSLTPTYKALNKSSRSYRTTK
jgi:hypothetical protein